MRLEPPRELAPPAPIAPPVRPAFTAPPEIPRRPEPTPVGPAPTAPPEPVVPAAGGAPGSVEMRAALGELVALWDALPDPAPEDRAALWAMRGELRRLRILEGYLNGFLRG